MKACRSKLLTNLAAILFIFLLNSPIRAATHEISGSVDIFGTYTGDTYGPISPAQVTVAVGDTVNLTYVFKDGRKLRLSDVENGIASFARVSPWLGFVGTPCGVETECGDFTVSNWSISLVGARSKSGIAPEYFSGTSQGSCCNHLGTDGFFYLEDGDYLEFSGISTSFTVDSLPSNPNTYSAIRTRFFANSVTVISPVSIALDIYPNDRVRCKNARSVVIHGDTDFDVSQIDINTLHFGESEDGAHVPKCTIDYADNDVYLDITCKFVPGTAESVISGELLDGSTLRGAATTCALN